MKLKNMENKLEKYKIETKIDPIAAYFTLITAMLKEPFMSSDSKYMIIQGSYSRLMELGYSREDVEDFSSKVAAFAKENIDRNCYAFQKYDGSNFRAEWGKKRGWYKYGTRNVMVDKNTPIYGEAIDIFLNKYGQNLDDIFRKEYKSVENFLVFGEFFGPNSFAGKHIDTESKDIIIFDVNRYRKGLLSPDEFVDKFGHLDIPKIIYKGIYNYELINDVKSNKYGLSEGVVCKGVLKTKKGGEEVWATKIKTNEWIRKVKLLYGDKALMEEFNNDLQMMKEYEYETTD